MKHHQDHSKISSQPITQSTINMSQQISSNELPMQVPSDMEFIFGFNVSTSQIMDLFEAIANQNKFELIQLEHSYATAVKHAKKSFMQIIDCFNWWTQGNVTAIKMTITTRQKDSKRICRIRGLIGSKKQVIEFIDKFKNRSSALVQSKQMIQEDEDIQLGEQQTNPFYLQSCAAYMFHKILSNEKYGIGNLLHTSINAFNNEFENAKESVTILPLPMKKAISTVQEVVSNLYKDFNYGRQQMQQIMPYCRISVEKYVFEKIYTTIYNIYGCKNQNVIKQYLEKRNKILNTLSPANIFKEIGLAEKLWMTKTDEPQLNTPGVLLTLKCIKNYKRASKQLQRILGTQSPREKVKHCQIMFTTLKTIVYEGTPDNQELFNMEDIIPLLILIIIISDIQHIKNELDLMVDFIGFDPCDLESERRLLVNMSESFNYISRDWKMP